MAAGSVWISPLSDGFRYGYGLFETLKVAQGRLCYFIEHWERLCKGSRLLALPLNRTAEAIEADSVALVRANHVQEGVVRITYFKNESGLDWLITTEPLRYDLEQKALQGFKLCIADSPREHSVPWHEVKTQNYLENRLARERAKKNGYDEALFLNRKQEVSEGTASNLFWVKDNAIYTPSIACVIVAGVIRSKVVELTEKLGLMLHTGVYSVVQLYAAQEAFITNSLLGIMPIAQLGSKRFDLTQNSQTRRLRNALCQDEQVDVASSSGVIHA